MARAYLSLGSNVGDREAHLHDAMAALGELGMITKTSSVYETEPVEFQAQAWFLNCVVELETERPVRELMAGILAIEKKMGRHRSLPKGPRNIDLDILLFENQMVDEPGIKVPHPAMQRRRFVLAPLAEISPDAIHPVSMRSASNLLEALGDEGGVVRRLPEPAK